MEPGLLGRWRVQVHKWTWIYDFDAHGGVRWTDPVNGMTGRGIWKRISDRKLRTSWAPSKTTEEWNLPIDPRNQQGTCSMEEGIYPLRATLMAALPSGAPPGLERRTEKYRMSEAGKRFLASDPIEGFRSRLYNDSAGHCTIGVGTLVHLGACNGSESQEFKNGITLERAIQLMSGRVAGFEAAFNRDVDIELQQHQVDALLSFCYNTGGLHELLDPVNAGQFDKLPELIRTTRTANNAIVRMRRRNEARLFENADYNAHF